MGYFMTTGSLGKGSSQASHCYGKEFDEAISRANLKP